jgi:hypothetical protein
MPGIARDRSRDLSCAGRQATRYLARAKSALSVEVVPAATIFPSGWRAIAAAAGAVREVLAPLIAAAQEEIAAARRERAVGGA